jgi:thiamine monophosphate kinase
VSDGLLADAQHIAESSRVDLVFEKFSWSKKPSDNYELLFTISRKNLSQLSKIRSQIRFLGTVVKGSGKLWTKAGEKRRPLLSNGWDHLK